MRAALTAGGDGANISNLNQKILSNLIIKIPSLKTQLSAIEELESFQSSIRKTLAQYNSKLNDLEDLRQSLLQKAFAGELT